MARDMGSIFREGEPTTKSKIAMKIDACGGARAESNAGRTGRYRSRPTRGKKK